uniref:Uncharacterized protein n=1 Tax=Glossina palpalis gambiensis TaxID=67801 RepID=A0A1B0BUD9_9MUSC
MVFIAQEANEKAAKFDAKAEEEFRKKRIKLNCKKKKEENAKKNVRDSVKLPKAKGEYNQVLEKFILQVVFQTMQQSAILRSRQTDVDLFKEILPSVINNYQEIIGDDIEIAFDRENHLSSISCIGNEVIALKCPTAMDGMERFACPTPDVQGRYRCIDDHVLCDGFIDCPEGEDEDRRSCMFYKTTKAHLDVLADALLRWARGR